MAGSWLHFLSIRESFFVSFYGIYVFIKPLTILGAV